jgi:ubiquinone biosynthesis protein COQ9
MHAMALPIRRLKPFACPRYLRSVPAIAKQYHSYDHPTAPPYPPSESAILAAALTHVPEHGFTQASLTRGAQDAGYLPISMNLFPRGVFDLVLFYLAQRRLALKDAVAGEGLLKTWDEGKVGVGGRVRGLVLERLRMNAKFGVVGRWQEVCHILKLFNFTFKPYAMIHLH